MCKSHHHFASQHLNLELLLLPFDRTSNPSSQISLKTHPLTSNHKPLLSNLNHSFISSIRSFQSFFYFNQLFISIIRSFQSIVHFNHSFLSINRSFQSFVHFHHSFLSIKVREPSEVPDAPNWVSAEEGAAYGAALLAATGSGAFESVPSACKNIIQITGHTAPGKNVQTYEELYPIYRDLYPALSPILFNKLG